MAPSTVSIGQLRRLRDALLRTNQAIGLLCLAGEPVPEAMVLASRRLSERTVAVTVNCVVCGMPSKALTTVGAPGTPEPSGCLCDRCDERADAEVLLST